MTTYYEGEFELTLYNMKSSTVIYDTIFHQYDLILSFCNSVINDPIINKQGSLTSFVDYKGIRLKYVH